MKRQDDARLDNAIEALRHDEPDSEAVFSSAERVSNRLGIIMRQDMAVPTIQNCHDVQQLLDSYREGTLPDARALLVKAHLSDCGACLRRFREGGDAGAVDWSTPTVIKSPWLHPRALGWALAISFALFVSAFFVYKAYWEIPPGVRAEVQSIDGSAYLISASGDRQLTPGAEIREGEHLRTTGASHAVLRLSDGSIVEVRERSALGVGARGHDMTVALDNGAVIVQAAKRSSGHLYVRTPDCRVAVTGTVFSVDSGIKGSRVAVLQGVVNVMHAGTRSVLQAGDQIATSDNLSSAPLEQQIAWSRDSGKYLQLLAQFSTLRNRIGQIPFPQPRYGSDLLARVPAETALYISIPNLGAFLNEANTVFQDQLNQSPELQEWWGRGHDRNTADLDALVEKLDDVTQYLGDEVVVVGVKKTNQPEFAILADVQKSGLDELLKGQFASVAGGMMVFNEQTLASAVPSGNGSRGVYALVRQHEVVFSNTIDMLKQLDVQLNAGASGFASGEFGKQISAAYDRGAGIILAADLHQMLGGLTDKAKLQPAHKAVVRDSGIEGAQYLIAEHRETNGMPENHLNLQFSGERQRVASWLASPAPIGSLDFVTPNAAFAVAVLSKDPKSIADDIIAMASANNGHKGDWSAAEAKLQINVRDDLIANLGGDFLVSLDGPVLPTPSWKVVIEVNDSDRLENTLERLVQAINSQPHGKDIHSVGIEASASSGQRFYTVNDLASGTTIANYTFSDGFMIIAPSRALLIDAMRTHTSGNSLARSAAFRSLLPKDENENYSAVAYQNLSPVLTPILSQVTGESADAIRKLAADSRPTAICAWGKDSRIEVASDSRLFGFDFLTLGALINSRNKSAVEHVSQ